MTDAVSSRTDSITFVKVNHETIHDYSIGLSSLHQRIHKRWRTPDFWRWCYLENPYGSGTILAIQQDQVIGKLGHVYSTFNFDGCSVKAGLLEGLEVLPEKRSWQCFRGILASSLEVSQNDGITFGYAFANKASTRLNQQLGWSVLGRVPVYAAFLDVRQTLVDRGFASPLKWLGAPLQPIIGTTAGKEDSAVTRYKFRSIHHFDETFDELWDSVKRSRRRAVVKDSQYLNWRYLGSSGRKHECWGVYQNDRLQGCVVFRTRRQYREGCLLDLIARENDPEILRSAVDWTLSKLRAKSVGLLRASFPKGSPEGQLLLRMGFQAWTSAIARLELVVTTPNQKEEAGRSPSDLDNWHFSLGDWLYF
jgi:hypothetical protein